MGIVAVEELPLYLRNGRTLAGLDLGDKTIGIAVSDSGLSFSHPRPVIMRRKFSLDADVLLAQLTRDNVGAVVLGLPINMDGSEGPRAQKSRAFVRNMASLTALPFVLWDERLSTVAAERTLIEMVRPTMPPSRNRAAVRSHSLSNSRRTTSGSSTSRGSTSI